MVAIVRVPVTDFSPERLDTGFYSQEYYAARAQINKSGLSLESIGSVCEPWQFGAYALCNDIVWSNADEGIPFLKAEAIESPLVNESALSYVTKATHSLLAKSSLKAGDIIMSTSGTVGRLAVLPDAIPVANSNQDTIKFSLAGTTYDSHFVAAWLTSKYAQAFMSREAGGAVQQHIYLYNFKRLPLLKLAPAIQKYIGDKVRQAERLRAWGKNQYDTATSLFDKLVSEFGYVPRPNKQSVWAKLDNRLDPAYYAPQYSFLNESWFTSRCKPLSTYIEDGAYGVLPDSNSYGSGEQKFIRATDIKVSNIDPTAFTFVPADQVTSKARVKTNDILLEIKGAIEACELAGRDLEGTYVNGSIYRFTPKGITPGYLAFYLRSFVKQLYCQRVSVNNIISYLDLGSICNLPVVRLGQENEDLIEQSFLQQLDAARLSFRLTTSAKFLVEALIEGLLTEAEVNAAEQALQAGNDQLDRQILNRLKTDGIDGQGQALFSDLDQLYSLLQQASHS